MRFTELFLAVPGLALALAIVAALGPGITNGVIALAIVWWPGYVRLVEAKTLSVKEELSWNRPVRWARAPPGFSGITFCRTAGRRSLSR